MTQLWVVGRFGEDGQPWEIQGVFDDQHAADACALDVGDRCFVGPVMLNVPLPAESVEWPGAYIVSRVSK